MADWYSLLSSIDSALGSTPALLTISSFLFAFKGFVLFRLMVSGNIFKSSNNLSFYLSLMIIGAMASDFSWICQEAFSILGIKKAIIHDILIILCWGLAIVQYHSQALFIDCLVNRGVCAWTLRQRFLLVISSIFFILFQICCLAKIIGIERANDIVHFLLHIIVFYILFLLLMSSIFLAIIKIKSSLVPRILRRQLNIFIVTIIVPQWLFDLLQAFPFGSAIKFSISSYTLLNLSNMFIIGAAIYSARRMMGLRFLNLKDHVRGLPQLDFIPKFKTVLERLSGATSEHDVTKAVQEFFKVGLNVEAHKVFFRLRLFDKECSSNKWDLSQKNLPEAADDTQIKVFKSATQRVTDTIEIFLRKTPSSVTQYVSDAKVLIYDEIAFNNFYQETEQGQLVARFLEEITADVFLPIVYYGQVVAYIALDKDARSNGVLYTDVERDQMLVFATYLGNIIHLMQNKNLEVLMQRETALTRELHLKSQEVQQYKQSVQALMRTGQRYKQVGIIFYRNRRFTYGNTLANELIKINLNLHHGHELAKLMKDTAAYVLEHGSPQTALYKDDANQTLVIDALPGMENQTAVILVYYPEPSDIIRLHASVLKDPSDWDFLLYLQTTAHGQRINNVVPGWGQELVDLKIKILKIALGKRPILLDQLANDDIATFVDMFHAISERDILHTINLTRPIQATDVSIKLFGGSSVGQTSLLERLDGSGTLFIKNIHFLPLEAQEYIAEFIRLGAFRPMKAIQLITADVRIICSSDQSLSSLVKNHTFSSSLFQELIQGVVHLPSLITLPKKELVSLIDGITKQKLHEHEHQFKTLIGLSERDHDRVAHQPPTSLTQFKERVHAIIEHKAKKSIVDDDQSSLHQADFDRIARLGKNALQDKAAMTLLWQTFKSQNQIAAYLGVNRSSVNRRCREFGLE